MTQDIRNPITNDQFFDMLFAPTNTEIVRFLYCVLAHLEFEPENEREVEIFTNLAGVLTDLAEHRNEDNAT